MTHLIESLAALSECFAAQGKAFADQPYPDAERRRAQLAALITALRRSQTRLAEAVSADFGGRSRTETRLLELFPALESLRYARRHLRAWMKDRRFSAPIWYRPARLRMVYQPKGVVGIIVPWNYPILLALGPLAGALAAGNRVLLKMSEHTPRTARVLAETLAECFGRDTVALVGGDLALAQAFSALPFDHLFFTGSTAVGRRIMASASLNLTPLTLELGGKSPVLIDEGYPLPLAVERVLHGKCLNAGQTCVAPDYALLPAAREEAFIELARAAIDRWYPRLESNPDYSSIINEGQSERLRRNLEEARAAGARVVPLAESAGRRMPPTLVFGAENTTLMSEEIFGPILPVISYSNWDEAVRFINERPRPLALYYFGYNKTRQEQLLRSTHSGGVGINETLLHVAQEEIPFGGIGEAGMGQYHGFFGFATFSHAKGVFEQSRWTAFSLLRPPYRRLSEWFLNRVL